MKQVTRRSLLSSLALVLSMGMLGLGLTFTTATANAANKASRQIPISPGVSILPLAETDVAFTVPPEMADYAHSYFVLVNNSERDIAAVTVIWGWQSIEQAGKPRGGIQKTIENYGNDKSVFGPVVAAHSRIMLDPGTLAGSHAFADAVGKKIALTFDSVIFSDGEIVGPDKLNIGADLTARYDAAQAVSQQFAAGKRDGIAPILTANKIHQDPPAAANGNPFEPKWRATFASKVAASTKERPELTDLHIRDLGNLPKPPKFFKLTKEGN